MISGKNRLNYILLLIFTATSSLFFYCNSSHEQQKNIKNANDYNPYFPVADGINWEYINPAPTDESLIFDVSVAGISNNDESVTAGFSSFPFFSKQNAPCSVRITKSGEVYVKDSTENEKMLLPETSKLQKGYSWEYGYWSAAIIDTAVTVKTENHEYKNCMYVSYSLGGITFSVELWLAKGEGIVKWGANRTNPPSRSITYYVLK